MAESNCLHRTGRTVHHHGRGPNRKHHRAGRGGRQEAPGRLQVLLDLETGSHREVVRHAPSLTEQEATTDARFVATTDTEFGHARSRTQANLSGPGSALRKVKGGYVQGANAHAVVAEDQHGGAAEGPTRRTTRPRSSLDRRGEANLRRTGEKRRLRRVVVDAVTEPRERQPRGTQALVAPSRSRQFGTTSDAEQRRALCSNGSRQANSTRSPSHSVGSPWCRVNPLLRIRRPGNPEPLTTAIVAKLDAPQGNGRKKQAATIEPVCAQITYRPRDPHVPASRQPPIRQAVSDGFHGISDVGRLL